MDRSSSTSEKPDKFTGFLDYAHCWTLKQDKELKDALQTTVSGMLDAIRHFETVGNALESEMELFETRLENLHNGIGCLKMERLVKEQVDEIPVDLLRGRLHKKRGEHLPKEVSREEYERRTISAISNAIRRGFELFNTNSTVMDDQQQLKDKDQQMRGIDPTDPSSSTAMSQKRPDESVNGGDGTEMLTKLLNFELGELPPIIGTAEFYETLIRANEAMTDSATANAQRGRKGASTMITTSDKIEETEDIVSMSSGRSAPPQDPVVQSPPVDTERGEGIDEQHQRVEKKQETAERQRIKEAEEQGTKRATVEKQWEGERATDMQSIAQRQLLNESVEERTRNEEEQRIKEDPEKQRARRTTAMKSNRPKRSVKQKSLFSSSEEEDEDEQQQQEAESFKYSIRPVPELQRPKQQLEIDSHSAAHLPFDRSLSQRPLSAQPIGPYEESFTPAGDAAATRPPPALVRKTESAIAVSSVVSNNEELGPTSVKNRIAQIGAHIPVGHQRSANGTRREEEDNRRSGGNDQRTERRTEATTADASAMAPLPAEAIKTRAKAPSARRAPSQRTVSSGKTPSSASSVVDDKETVEVAAEVTADKQPQPTLRVKPPPVPTAKARGSSDLFAPTNSVTASAHPHVAASPKTTTAKVVPPPPVKPKKTRSSIFSSSSSDDDLGFAKVIGATKARLPVPRPHQRANEVPKTAALLSQQQDKQLPPFSYKKTTVPAKTRKGLFDDSESDF